MLRFHLEHGALGTCATIRSDRVALCVHRWCRWWPRMWGIMRSPYVAMVVVMTSLLMFSSGVAASAATTVATDTVEFALTEFRSNLTAQSSTNSDAANNLARFDALSPEQRDELAHFLLGESTPHLTETDMTLGALQTTATDGDFQVMTTDGDFQWNSTLSAPPATSTTTTYSVHATGDETFSFAGIVITRTRVWADYVTGSGVVKRIANYGCQAITNYDAFAEVKVSNAGSSLSGGRATFLCDVVVKRGVPTAWGHVSWSTRSGIQYLSVNGRGVTGHEWR